MPSYYNTLSRPRTTSPWASQFTTQTWKSRTWMKMNNYHQKLTSDFTKKLFVSRKQTLESNRENTQCDTLHTYIKAINTHRRCQNYCHKWNRSSTIATNDTDRRCQNYCHKSPTDTDNFGVSNRHKAAVDTGHVQHTTYVVHAPFTFLSC